MGIRRGGQPLPGLPECLLGGKPGACASQDLAGIARAGWQLTLTSRAFRNDQLSLFYQELCELTGYEMALPMNTGAEAVETAIKLARKWAYVVKGVPRHQAEIITCREQFSRANDHRHFIFLGTAV